MRGVNDTQREFLESLVLDFARAAPTGLLCIRCCWAVSYKNSRHVNEFHRETNLKVRHALSVTSALGEDISRLAEFDGECLQ